MDTKQESLSLHREWAGKIEVTSRVPVGNSHDLSVAYTPGVAEPCREIHADPGLVDVYTRRWNQVAVVSDGSAVLGLGNIGARAALPVMEGKAVLFKAFAGVDAFPICLDTQDVEETIRTVELLVPTFGGVNLEDISAPRCFEIERRLKESTDIPIFHDDQHGTAVVVLSGIINACRLTGRELGDLHVVVNGAGAAGIACAKLMLDVGGTGRSDFHNQVNNVLGFPGIFRGALDVKATHVNESMKIAAAHALADLVGDRLSPEYVIPEAFDLHIAPEVAAAVAQAAVDSGVAGDPKSAEWVRKHTRSFIEK